MPHKLKTKQMVVSRRLRESISSVEKSEFDLNLKNKNNDYYGEITIGTVLKSKLDLNLIQNIYSEENLRGRLILELPNGDTTVLEIQDIFETEWDQIN